MPVDQASVMKCLKKFAKGNGEWLPRPKPEGDRNNIPNLSGSTYDALVIMLINGLVTEMVF